LLIGTILSLTSEQKNFIQLMDSEAKSILEHGGQEDLLMSLCNKMEKINEIMDASSQDELNQYCAQYEGFYEYMKLLEKLAQGCEQGIFDDVIN
tara:strand:+ start:23265 stop:23546 length:282 start_codon:yes stop_codon:yes gene_type:complete